MSDISVRILSKDFTASGPGVTREEGYWGGVTITPGRPGFIEWKVSLPFAGRWNLHALMTAESSRPVTLVINGTKQPAPILGDVTGGWHANSLKWFVYGPYDFKIGENVIRIEVPEAIPHLKEFGFSLVEMATDPKIAAIEKQLADQARLIAALTESMNKCCSACEEKLAAHEKRIAALEQKLAEAPKLVDPTNLEIVEGIGPKIAELLNGAGIRTLEQLAAAQVSVLKEILVAGGARYATADPSTWPKQARLAADGQLKELAAYQATLRSGRS